MAWERFLWLVGGSGLPLRCMVQNSASRAPLPAALPQPLPHTLCRYTPEQVYDVVANVEEYKEFVPWCVRSVVLSRPGPNRMEAELEVGFQMFSER